MSESTRPYRTDEDGNTLWQASSEGDNLCPVCGHSPEVHVSTFGGCQWHYADGSHMTEPSPCACPLEPVDNGSESACCAQIAKTGVCYCQEDDRG